MRTTLSDLVQLLPMVEGKPDAMIALARQLSGAGARETAFDLAARAMAASPENGSIATRAAELLSETVHGWHFLIVRDKLRNDAYEQALQRAIRPGSKVLEIGTGSGLLAMMAARLGGTVVTCEANPAIAAAARDVIAANGLCDRIRVVGKHSSDLTLDDVGGQADILVSEIVSNDLLSENVLPAHADVIARLLKPGASVIPARGKVRVALAHDAQWQRNYLGMVSGFDLSAFNRLSRPSREMPVQSPHITMRSDALDLFEFNFSRADIPAVAQSSVAARSTGGAVNGIIQWIALDMDDEGSYENRPGGDPSCWGALFWPFRQVLQTDPDQIITIVGNHEVDRLRIWCK
jgi:SAM-dependent methyltransferase